MNNKLVWKKLSDVNLSDSFFDSLRDDYPDFDKWFTMKQNEGRSSMVLDDEKGIHAFLFLKRENEEIYLSDRTLPKKWRIKISTLKIDQDIGGQRWGEGLVGVSLWYWQQSKYDEIYVTVYEKHTQLIAILQKFGFTVWGKALNGELYLFKSRGILNYKDAYSAFPFISPNINKAGLLPINDTYHDLLFPYSETQFSKNDIEGITAGNGITKVFIATPSKATTYSVGEIIGIYRIYTGEGSRKHKSAITSFGIITKITIVKDRGRQIQTLPDYLKEAGNKTVFSETVLRQLYNNNNVVMIEMTYNGYFIKGNDVTWSKLNDMGLINGHPYSIEYNMEQFKTILKCGGKDVHNIIID